MSDVVKINMQSERPKVTGEHVHRCPVCYEAPPCRETCSIETDLTLDDGTLCGAHLTCEACRGGRYQEHAFAFLGRQATDEEVWTLARFVEKLCKAAQLEQRRHIAKMAVDAGMRLEAPTIDSLEMARRWAATPIDGYTTRPRHPAHDTVWIASLALLLDEARRLPNESVDDDAPSLDEQPNATSVTPPRETLTDEGQRRFLAVRNYDRERPCRRVMPEIKPRDGGAS